MYEVEKKSKGAFLAESNKAWNGVRKLCEACKDSKDGGNVAVEKDRKINFMAADLEMRDGNIVVLKRKIESCENVEKETDWKASRKQCKACENVDLELEKVKSVKEEEKKLVQMKIQREREEQERMIGPEKYKVRGKLLGDIASGGQESPASKDSLGARKELRHQVGLFMQGQ